MATCRHKDKGLYLEINDSRYYLQNNIFQALNPIV
jgi:hypothetical protein